LPQNSREYIQYLREKEHNSYWLEEERGCHWFVMKMFIIFWSAIILCIFVSNETIHRGMKTPNAIGFGVS
jgi:hypothetical protein